MILRKGQQGRQNKCLHWKTIKLFFTFSEVCWSDGHRSGVLAGAHLVVDDAVGQVAGAVQLPGYVLAHKTVDDQVEFWANLVNPFQVLALEYENFAILLGLNGNLDWKGDFSVQISNMERFLIKLPLFHHNFVSFQTIIQSTQRKSNRFQY